MLLYLAIHVGKRMPRSHEIISEPRHETKRRDLLEIEQSVWILLASIPKQLKQQDNVLL